MVQETSPRTNHKSLPVRFEATYLLTSLFVNLPPRDFFESKLHSERSLDLATQPGFHLLDLFHRDAPTPHLGQRSSSPFNQAQSKTNQPRSVPWGSPKKGVFSMGHHFHDMYAALMNALGPFYRHFRTYRSQAYFEDKDRAMQGRVDPLNPSLRLPGTHQKSAVVPLSR